jgi:hypothetical protein
MRLPARAARQLPEQSTTLRVDSSSTSDPRLRGALPIGDIAVDLEGNSHSCGPTRTNKLNCARGEVSAAPRSNQGRFASRCKGPLMARCHLHPFAGSPLEETGRGRLGRSARILGRGPSVPLATGNQSDSLHALVGGRTLVGGRMVELGCHIPWAYFAEQVDGRIDKSGVRWNDRGCGSRRAPRARAHRRHRRAAPRSA